jgi:outer membrane protein assembly factor BamA
MSYALQMVIYIYIGDCTIHVSDRFFLGHQMNMRHFAPFTIGPRDAGILSTQSSPFYPTSRHHTTVYDDDDDDDNMVC